MLNQILSTGPKNQRIALVVLIAMYLAGVVGLSFESSRELFQSLTPFNLLLTGAIVFHFEEKKTAPYFLYIILVFLFGFGVEVLGVQSGVVFGHYSYGETLGFKVWGVPLAIGLNWAILIYITGFASNAIAKSIWLRCLIGACFMVVLDLLIEPVAIAQDFWNWEKGHIPFKNYVGWFFISYIFQFLFQKLPFSKNNPLAIKLLYIVSLFFVSLNLI